MASEYSLAIGEGIGDLKSLLASNVCARDRPGGVDICEIGTAAGSSCNWGCEDEIYATGGGVCGGAYDIL